MPNLGPGLTTSLPFKGYESKARVIAMALDGYQERSAEEWMPTARLLFLACNYGAGDTFAEVLFNTCPGEVVEQMIGTLKTLFPGWEPTNTLLVHAVWSLFKHRTGNPKVDAILEKLHNGATLGQGFTV